MSDKIKEPFRFRTGFFFGLGFMAAAYLVMFFVDGFLDFLIVIMKGLGFGPGIFM